MENIEVCRSCRIGKSGVSRVEISSQIDKYGVYICKNCERVVEDIKSGKYEKFLIMKDGIYEDKGLKGRNNKYLGFGGRLFMITEIIRYRPKKVYLTNDLFLIVGIHSSFYNEIKSFINAEKIDVDFSSFEVMKEQLGRRDFE